MIKTIEQTTVKYQVQCDRCGDNMGTWSNETDAINYAKTHGWYVDEDQHRSLCYACIILCVKDWYNAGDMGWHDTPDALDHEDIKSQLAVAHTHSVVQAYKEMKEAPSQEDIDGYMTGDPRELLNREEIDALIAGAQKDNGGGK